MHTIETLVAFLQRFAPPALAEDWDNVGLLVGDRSRRVDRVMTCLSVTPTTAAEAIDRGAQLIVAHHPMPFEPVRRLTTDTTVGRLLLDLIAQRIAVYSPHTAFDSAREGINQRLAAGLGLQGIEPLVAAEDGFGSGRFGQLEGPLTLMDLAARVKQFLQIERLQMVGRPEQSIRTLGVACGAAGTFLEPAHQQGCDGLLLGETRFHTCLEAEALGMGLLLPGHFASERFALECLAEVLAGEFPELEVWASRQERDPLAWIG